MVAYESYGIVQLIDLLCRDPYTISEYTQSHRIVRFLDRTIGCDLANVRPIGNVCYDLQKRSAYCDRSFDWWYAIVRLVVRVVARSTTIGEDRWQDPS